MTNEQLSVIEGVLKDATPGPLNHEIGEYKGYWCLTDHKGNIVADDVRTDDVKGGANASLFINAHLWCSDLLAEVRRLRAEVADGDHTPPGAFEKAYGLDQPAEAVTP